MGTSNILGGLLMGLGQGRMQLQREEFEREEGQRDKLHQMTLQLMQLSPPDTQQALTALLMM